MKIEIDLDDIFRDEDGTPEESLESSIRRQVLERLSGDLRKRLFQQMDSQLSDIMQKLVSEAAKKHIPDLIEDILNVEYKPVDRYGSSSAPTTFRAEIIKAIGENMKYQPKQYQGEENAFTRAVRSVVELKTNAIKDEITKQVDVNFKTDAIKFAVEKLSERLGLKK